MKNVFELAEICLHHSDIEQKLATTHLAWQLAQREELCFSSVSPVQSIELTCFPTKPVLLAPKYMPKRSLTTSEGIAAFFHALTHIEFMAIYLAWDMLYRFRGLPQQFYQDWLQVAYEEAQHFTLLRAHLQHYGFDYGDLPAHQGLWEHAQDTSDAVLARLAIVPRCMEARGLDITPAMIERFKTRQDEVSVTILEQIFLDEIGHVKFGSYWFNTICVQQGIDALTEYKELLTKFYKGKPKGPFNREMRIIAGFSTAELDWLENR